MKTEHSTLEKKLNLSTLLFSILAIIFVFISLLCLDETKYEQGGLLGTSALGFCLLALWSQKSPFYSLIAGLFFYLGSMASLCYFFPRIITDGTGFFSPYIYILLFFLFNVYLITREYQKQKISTPTNNSEKTTVKESEMEIHNF
ncbi:MAG: hypothetical protein JWO58_749 [Chitinophagaceae bacterium]|nr:hypothetical protein [Chitinophagaceae bacterium]